jgi:hypothetical protein
VEGRAADEEVSRRVLGQERIFVRKTVMPSASGSTPLRVGGCLGLFRGLVVYGHVVQDGFKFRLHVSLEINQAYAEHELTS